MEYSIIPAEPGFYVSHPESPVALRVLAVALDPELRRAPQAVTVEDHCDMRHAVYLPQLSALRVPVADLDEWIRLCREAEPDDEDDTPAVRAELEAGALPMRELVSRVMVSSDMSGPAASRAVLDAVERGELTRDADGNVRQA